MGGAVLAFFASAVLIVMGMQLQQTYVDQSIQDWRGIEGDLSGNTRPIYIAPGFQWQSLAYYRGTALG